jgi:transcription antitermination factor NusG
MIARKNKFKPTVKKKASSVKSKSKSPPKKQVKKQVKIFEKPSNWVALELTQRGEAEKDVQILVDLIKRSLGDPNLEIFVPIYYENEEFFEKNVSLFSGYFFIRHAKGLPYHKLKETKYFEGVVCNPMTNEAEIIPNSQIDSLKDKFENLIEQASQIKVGQTVRLLDGLYKNLTGKVTRVIKKEKMCIIKITSLKSRNITISAPFMSVLVEEDMEDNSDVPTFF